jgi:hypothetical protein
MWRLLLLVIITTVVALLGMDRMPNSDTLVAGSIKAPLTELFRRDGNLFEPNWIIADAGHKLWVSDAVHQSLTLYKYDLQNDEATKSLRMGRGPGELAEMGMKWMSTLSSGDKVIFDVGSYRMQRYNAELEKPTAVRITSGPSQWLNAHILADTLLVVSPMSPNHVLQIYQFDPKANQTGTLVYQLGNLDKPELKLMSNFLLKNGHVAVHGNSIYYSYLFAPYVLKVDPRGLQWIGGTEIGSGFPVNTKNPNEIRMPDASQHAQQTISIAADADRVYVLHNGEKAGFWKSMWATVTNDFSDIDEQLNASNRLRIYNARNGSFVQEWTLPVRARLVSVHREFMYLTTQVNGQSTVVAYRMNR